MRPKIQNVFKVIEKQTTLSNTVKCHPCLDHQGCWLPRGRVVPSQAINWELPWTVNSDTCTLRRTVAVAPSAWRRTRRRQRRPRRRSRWRRVPVLRPAAEPAAAASLAVRPHTADTGHAPAPETTHTQTTPHALSAHVELVDTVTVVISIKEVIFHPCLSVCLLVNGLRYS